MEPKFHYLIHMSLPPITILRQSNVAHDLLPDLFNP